MNTEHIIVFAWGFVPAALWLGYHVINDVWRNRWRAKIRGRDHDTDLEAFLWNFVDDTTPNLCWWKIFITPFIAGLVVSMIWWFIYATVMMVQ